MDLDVEITGADGATWTVPAFWAGDDRFKVRFAGPVAGRYTLRSRCSDATDAGLHDQVAELTVIAYDGSNELYRHGRIGVTPDKRRFEHADGTPFLWLADTHWQAFTSRLDWPHGFATLADDRAAKGFSVVHVVAGPLSGFDADESWHPHQANEAGWPWEEGWTRINPDFYEAVDLKIAGYVERGLMPCIVGMWGYYMNLMGIERVRRHWRYLVARYGALPVVWCLAGEVQMAVYSVQRGGGQPHADALAEQADGWTEMSQYVHAIDPFHSLVDHAPCGDRKRRIDPGCRRWAASRSRVVGQRPIGPPRSTPSSTSTCSSAAISGSSCSSRRSTSSSRQSPNSRSCRSSTARSTTRASPVPAGRISSGSSSGPACSMGALGTATGPPACGCSGRERPSPRVATPSTWRTQVAVHGRT